MPRYVRVLDSAIGVPRVADTLAQWVDVDDLIEIPEGGGVTNSASINSIPITTDGDGNLGASPLTIPEENEVHFVVPENGSAQIEVEGLGGQLHLRAAEGDESHVGGEVTIMSGGSNGQSGGQVTITGGSDLAGGDGAGITIQSGNAGAVGMGGSSGDIELRVGGGNAADGQGGDVLISAGIGTDGRGGRVTIDAGPSTNGAQGSVRIHSPDGNQGALVDDTAFNVSDKLAVIGNVGFYGTSPVARPEVPASPTEQDVVDALIALGLVTQAS